MPMTWIDDSPDCPLVRQLIDDFFQGSRKKKKKKEKKALAEMFVKAGAHFLAGPRPDDAKAVTCQSCMRYFMQKNRTHRAH